MALYLALFFMVSVVPGLHDNVTMRHDMDTLCKAYGAGAGNMTNPYCLLLFLSVSLLVFMTALHVWKDEQHMSGQGVRRAGFACDFKRGVHWSWGGMTLHLLLLYILFIYAHG